MKLEVNSLVHSLNVAVSEALALAEKPDSTARWCTTFPRPVPPA
jgi:hypothetical protein